MKVLEKNHRDCYVAALTLCLPMGLSPTEIACLYFSVWSIYYQYILTGQ